MKKSKKFVLAALALLAITGLLALAGCKNDSVPEPTRYTVSFDTNGGSEVAPQIVESGNTIKEPPVTYPGTKNELYRWKDESGAKVEFPLKVEKNMSLTAEWGIKVGDTVYPKTSEVQVLSKEVYLKDLHQVDSERNSVSQIFVKNRVDSIKPFVMGQYEVTQQLYFAVMGKNPSRFKTGAEDEEPKEGWLPVEWVSWYDAVVFCNELSELMRLESVYSKGGTTNTSEWGEVPTSSDEPWEITCNWNANGYRLPTEAEWELAARGGDPEEGAWKYTYAGSDTIDDVAWYKVGMTHQVGTKSANSLNLYDMSGNVLEWCWDRDGSITEDTPSDGAATGSSRVYRGGSLTLLAEDCTVSNRSSTLPYLRYGDHGFRLVRSAN